MIGQKLNNRYKILSLLGEGGMGEVYLAEDEQSKSQVAIKILARQLTAHPESLERFRREAKTLRQLDHPNIVKFIDAFEYERQYVIVMEYLQGGSLHDLLKQGRLPIERAREIALGLCDALIRSHQLNIIHRDIKPENVLLTSDGKPKLADFGVARLSEGTRMTRSGTQVGTPYYMSPEAWEGKQLDGQADIWSLGALLFEMLSGQIPFGGDTPLTVMNKIFTSELPDLKKLRKDVPSDLELIVKRMLAKDKNERYKTMRQVAVDLEGGEPSTQKPVKPAKPTRIVEPRPKIKFSRYRNIIIIGSLLIGLIFAINLIPSNPTSIETPIPTTNKIIESITPLITVTNTAIPVSPTPELGIGSTMVSEKDGMTLVFVPAGEFTMGSEDGDIDEKPVHQIYLDSFWIDQTEITNEMYKKCIRDSMCNVIDYQGQVLTNEYINLPVVGLTWADAFAYCSWAGRRLPTEAEWEKTARGIDKRIYPWGSNLPNNNLLNYNNEIGKLSLVGSYSNGVSPYGAFDMAGNVLEWVNDWYDTSYYEISPAINPLGPESGRFKVLRGGSWNLSDYFARTTKRLGGNGSSDQIGFRCALSETNSTTTANIPTTITSSELEIGSTMVSEKDGMTLVFVPAGDFIMGSDVEDAISECQKFATSGCTQSWFADKSPAHTVRLYDYFIDQTEVTNSMYAKCVDDGVCLEPTAKNSSTHPSYFGNPEFDEYPVIHVDWNMAVTYCSWAGRRLPTEAEWEKAAHGVDGGLYPWGDIFDGTKVNFCDSNCSYDWANQSFNDGYEDVSPVRSYPNGQSIYGVYDMSGNVWEWTSSIYQSYPYNADDGRENLNSLANRVFRGSSWYDSAGFYVRPATSRLNAAPEVDSYDLGFRCALSP